MTNTAKPQADTRLHAVVLATVKLNRAGDPTALRESVAARLDREEAEFRAMQKRRRDAVPVQYGPAQSIEMLAVRSSRAVAASKGVL